MRHLAAAGLILLGVAVIAVGLSIVPLHIIRGHEGPITLGEIALSGGFVGLGWWAVKRDVVKSFVREGVPGMVAAARGLLGRSGDGE